MSSKTKKHGRSTMALLLTFVMILSLFSTTAFASQEDNYHDPAEHWLTAMNRTNELDANSTITHETFTCAQCRQATSFTVFRVPEYTRDGQTAMLRNVKYSDGTLLDGVGTGAILDGTPGVDAYYTGYHWTKAVCETCGTINSNMGVTGYAYAKNVYWLYDCAAEFTETLDEVVTYEYADSTYHTKTTTTGTYCCFCFGTHKQESSVLERHVLNDEVLPQPANGRFALVESCSLCDYIHHEYVTAKSVIADYYGVVDGQPHTLSVTDLSEAGVSTQIRYGNSADSCTLTSAPNFTEKGQYTVYYEITYTYKNTSMTENGVAYVWLYDETAVPDDTKDDCPCGCGDPDCGCMDNSCGGKCCGDTGCGDDHSFILLDTTHATCLALGYDRYLCTDCGKIEKRDYVNALGHAWQSIVVREATCETDGKAMDICSRCGQVKTSSTPKGEHDYDTYSVPATCTSSGYTVNECSICGDRHITDITSALTHKYVSHTLPASCEAGGRTVHQCDGCGSSFVTDYTAALGHSWDEGTTIAEPSCTGEGVTEHRCVRCNESKLQTIPATGHTPGEDATCTDPQICTDCGAVIEKSLKHNFQAVVTDAACTAMGYTTYTCENCQFSYKSDYTDPLGHNHIPVVTEPTCLEAGYTTYTCSRCEDSYVSDHTEALGHEWDEGHKVTSPTCGGEGLMEYRCIRCDYHRLEALSAEGHTPGDAATCTMPQLCAVCGAVLENALGHNYESEVTAPTCTAMGYTTYTCTGCGDSYKGDYTDATGHKPSDWIIDKEPTTDSEGSKHKECENCGETLETEVIEKIYMIATTDTHGEAIVGGYLVVVTDTDSKNPVANATVALNADNTISVELPYNRLLDYADQTTVTVLLVKDESAVVGMDIAVTDRNDNYCRETTDKAGQITVPDTTGKTNNDGNTTVGYEDEDGNRVTLTINVADYETGRPIEGADISIGKTANITVILPDGTDMDENNRIIITVTDNKKNPQPDWTIIVKGDLGQSEQGQTDEDGKLIVPELDAVVQKHGAYIVGYTDGTFGPERSMTRSEAAAIFARLLADKNGDTITTVAVTKFSDIPEHAWYSGYVKYLTGYGVVTGMSDGTFAPNEPVTRSQFTAMAVRFFEAYGDGDPEIMEQYAEFNDVSSGYWAAEYIREAAIYGWIKGYGDGTFRGDDDITRAEVVTIVNRLLDREADVDYISANLSNLNTFPDVTEKHWAYYAVLEAANGHIATMNPDESWSK